ncbi:MAG: folate-binding protein YgfZ [Microbacteriaceae bacterium]|nr:folate-binding protein YgfZ [Microbacteriaceae bacterium]
MSDPFLDLSGAVESEGVAHHYGAPLAEQRALDEGDAVVSLSHHGEVTVSGADRLSWLHSMTSQHLLGLTPGESVETLLLSPQGRIEQVIRLVDDGERSWLLVDAGRAESLTAYLQRMRFALRVVVENVSDEVATLALRSDGRAAEVLRDSGLVALEWRDPWATVSAGGVQYAEHADAAASWAMAHLVVRRDDLERVAQLARDGSVRAAGLSALDALEIRAHRPSFHGEVDERAIPHEFDWLRSAVHLNKGCYRGQETVAKVHNLGHPPRRLALLHLEGSGGELPVAGAFVTIAGEGADAKPVGRVTRVALHHEWGGIALALMKRSVPEDAALAVALGAPHNTSDDDRDTSNVQHGRIAAAQEVIVPSGAGATRRPPKTARLGAPPR